jgi:hypothetical protein
LGGVVLDLVEYRLGPCSQLWLRPLLLDPLIDCLPDGVGNRQLAELGDHSELGVQIVFEANRERLHAWTSSGDDVSETLII